MRDEKPERVRKEVEFKSARGYKSVHLRIREQVAHNKLMKIPIIIAEEEKYETIETE